MERRRQDVAGIASSVHGTVTSVRRLPWSWRRPSTTALNVRSQEWWKGRVRRRSKRSTQLYGVSAATVGHVAAWAPLLVVPALRGTDGVDASTLSFLTAEALRHERPTVAMELAAALHHSRDVGPWKNDGLRAQTTASSRKRPGVLTEPDPQGGAVTVGYVAAGAPLLVVLARHHSLLPLTGEPQADEGGGGGGGEGEETCGGGEGSGEARGEVC